MTVPDPSNTSVEYFLNENNFPHVKAYLSVATAFRLEPLKRPNNESILHAVTLAIGFAGCYAYIQPAVCGWHSPYEIFHEQCGFESAADFFSIVGSIGLNGLLNYYFVFLFCVQLLYFETDGLPIEKPTFHLEATASTHPFLNKFIKFCIARGWNELAYFLAIGDSENEHERKKKLMQIFNNYRRLAKTPMHRASIAFRFVVFGVMAGLSAVPFAILDYSTHKNPITALITEFVFTALHYAGIQEVMINYPKLAYNILAERFDCVLDPKSEQHWFDNDSCTNLGRNLKQIRNHAVNRLRKDREGILYNIQTGRKTDKLKAVYDAFGKDKNNASNNNAETLLLITKMYEAGVMPPKSELTESNISPYFSWLNNAWESKAIKILRTGLHTLTLGENWMLNIYNGISGHNLESKDLHWFLRDLNSSIRRPLAQIGCAVGSYVAIWGYVVNTSASLANMWGFSSVLKAFGPIAGTNLLISPFLMIIIAVGIEVAGQLYDMGEKVWDNKSSLANKEKTWSEAFADSIVFPAAMQRNPIISAACLASMWGLAYFSAGPALYLNATTLFLGQLAFLNRLRLPTIFFTIVFNAFPTDKIIQFWGAWGHRTRAGNDEIKNIMNVDSMMNNLIQQMEKMDPEKFNRLILELDEMSRDTATPERAELAEKRLKALLGDDYKEASSVQSILTEKNRRYFDHNPVNIIDASRTLCDRRTQIRNNQHHTDPEANALLINNDNQALPIPKRPGSRLWTLGCSFATDTTEVPDARHTYHTLSR